MRILVISDSHGKNDDVKQVIEQVGEIDMFIHLGDIERGTDYIRELAGCECHMVAGNNDYDIDLPAMDSFMIGDKNVFALSEKEKILYRAKHMGIVFQQFNLINDMTCYDNVKIPLFLERTLPVGQRNQRIREKLSIVGMEHRMKHYPKIYFKTEDSE